MITVHILMPTRGDIMDISCEETLSGDKLLTRIQSAFCNHADHRKHLCHVDRRHILEGDRSLCESGVIDGSSLIMV